MALDPLEILRRDREAAARYAEGASRQRARSLLERAQLELNQRLTQAEGLSGAGPDSFSAAQMRAALAQVQAVLAGLTGGMQGALLDLGRDSASAAARNTVAYIGSAERAFRGSTRPLPLDTASLLDTAVRGSRSTILRRIASDPREPGRPGVLARYGHAVIGKFEDAMQQRLVQGKPWAEARGDLIAASPFLQGAPASWAERVLRTETMNVHNAAGQQTMEQVEAVVGPMLKILSATFDHRTAADSYAVHGQIRRVSEPFHSWFGAYMHPPNRPNDREVVVPHSMVWPIPDALKWRSDGEVAARWAAEGRKGSPPARPRMTTVDLELIGKPSAVAASPPPAFQPPAFQPPATPPPAPSRLPTVVADVPLVPLRSIVPQPSPEPPPPPPDSDAVSFARAVEHLTSQLLENAQLKKLGGGANDSKVASWVDAAGNQRKAVWKPAKGEERFLRYSIRAGTYHRREAAAYSLDRMLGADTVVPPTVSRTIKGEAGSIQQFEPGAKTAAKARRTAGGMRILSELDQSSSARRAQLLDFLTANTDRHEGNFMLAPNGKVVAIDNGLSFPDGTPERFLMLGKSLPDEQRSKLLSLDASQRAMLSKLDLAKVAKALADHGLEPRAVARTLERIATLQDDPDQIARLHREQGRTPMEAAQTWVQEGWIRTLRPERAAEIRAIVRGIMPGTTDEALASR